MCIQYLVGFAVLSRAMFLFLLYNYCRCFRYASLLLCVHLCEMSVRLRVTYMYVGSVCIWKSRRKKLTTLSLKPIFDVSCEVFLGGKLKSCKAAPKAIFSKLVYKVVGAIGKASVSSQALNVKQIVTQQFEFNTKRNHEGTAHRLIVLFAQSEESIVNFNVAKK